MATARALDDPELLPFLPFIYLAWSDGELGEAEVVSICQEFSQTGVHQDCRTAFVGWLDPQDPPSPNELSEMLEVIRARSADIDQPEALDIESFAKTLGASGRGQGELTPAEHDAIRMLGEQLGLSGREPTRAIVGGSTTDEALTSTSSDLDVNGLIALRDGVRHDIKERLRSSLTEPVFAHVPGQHMDEYRTCLLYTSPSPRDRG